MQVKACINAPSIRNEFLHDSAVDIPENSEHDLQCGMLTSLNLGSGTTSRDPFCTGLFGQGVVAEKTTLIHGDDGVEVVSVVCSESQQSPADIHLVAFLGGSQMMRYPSSRLLLPTQSAQSPMDRSHTDTNVSGQLQQAGPGVHSEGGLELLQFGRSQVWGPARPGAVSCCSHSRCKAVHPAVDS